MPGCSTLEWAGWRRVEEWLRPLLSLVYPEVCVLCGRERAGPREGYVGFSCRSAPGHVRAVGTPRCERCGLPYAGAIEGTFTCANCHSLDLQFDAARAAVLATPFLLEIIHRYKYQGAIWLELFLAELLLGESVPCLRGGGWDGLVPVPLHPLRERERGFNQAARLAARLSHATCIPVLRGVVHRRAATRTQTLLNRRERARNVAGAFEVRSRIRLDNRRLVVVDDVLTTGATTSAVSRALRQAGAAEVVVWTVARGT